MWRQAAKTIWEQAGHHGGDPDHVPSEEAYGQVAAKLNIVLHVYTLMDGALYRYICHPEGLDALHDHRWRHASRWNWPLRLLVRS